MSSSQDTSTDQTSHNVQGFDKKHLAIALGVGLSIVALITMCLLSVPSTPEVRSLEFNANEIDWPFSSTVAIANVVVLIANLNAPLVRNVYINSTLSCPVVPWSNGGLKLKFLLRLRRARMGILSGMYPGSGELSLFYWQSVNPCPQATS